MSSKKSNALKRPRYSKQPGLVNCMGRPASMCRYIKTRTHSSAPTPKEIVITQSGVFIFTLDTAVWTLPGSNTLPIINTGGSFKTLSYTDVDNGLGTTTVTVTYKFADNSITNDGVAFNNIGNAGIVTYYNNPSVEITQWGKYSIITRRLSFSRVPR